MVPLTLYGTGIVWSPHMYIWFLPHVKYLHVLYDSYGPPYLIWNRYVMVPLTLYGTCIVRSPHMWSIFVFYMTPMVPHTLYGIGVIWCPPHVCMVLLIVWYDFFMSPYLTWSRYLMVPLTLYGTGIIWSPTCMYGSSNTYYDSHGSPYRIWNRYLIVPPSSYWTGIIWSCHIYTWWCHM